MALKYQVFDNQALAFVGEKFDTFLDAFLSAQAHSPSAQVVAVESEDEQAS